MPLKYVNSAESDQLVETRLSSVPATAADGRTDIWNSRYRIAFEARWLTGSLDNGLHGVRPLLETSTFKLFCTFVSLLAKLQISHGGYKTVWGTIGP